MTKIRMGALLAGFLLAILVGAMVRIELRAESQAPTPSAYRALADEMDAYLQRHVLAPRFPATLDREHGGFHVNYDRQWAPQPDGNRFIVFQARMTWTAAKVALARPERGVEYLEYVRHGVAYLRDVFWDREFGGFQTYVGLKGESVPAFRTDKVAYGQAFAIYALAAAHAATKDPETLDLAQRAFRWVEEHYREDERPGYVGSVSREGKQSHADPDDSRPLQNAFGEPVEYRGMNAHIHLLEAYAELLRVWPDPTLEKRTRELLALARDRFFVEPGCLYLLLTPEGRGVPGPVSFGHDIETAFLLLEAAESLGEHDDPRTQRAARMLVDHTLAWGWNSQTGQIYERGFALQPAFDRSLEWWSQFEAMNALLLMHRIRGAETSRYWDAFLRTWGFIRDKLTDLEYGGVYVGVDAQGNVSRFTKSYEWFAAYHTARSLLLTADRLRTAASEAEKFSSAGEGSRRQ